MGSDDHITDPRLIDPSFSLLKVLLRERAERFADQKVKARCLLGFTRWTSLGCSPQHYSTACFHQLKRTCLAKFQVEYEGLQNIPVDEPALFVMKHRGFTDITLHGFAYAWATSGLHLDRGPSLLGDDPAMKEVISKGRSCRFVMKEDLLSLPIGLHLVINGGIPVPQDLETKALNTPGFDPKAPEVIAKTEKMAKWFSFKDSFREITTTLKLGGGVMIYGEATRVAGDRMGHLSQRMLERLARSSKAALIPVGTQLEGKALRVRYGAPSSIDGLRDAIAELSGISKDAYIP